MEILGFKPNIDGTELIITVKGIDESDELYLWDHTTYKDYSNKMDLTYMIQPVANPGSEDIIEVTVSAIDLGIDVLNGLYIIELQRFSAAELGETELALVNAITGVYTLYEECILNKLSALKICDDCLNKESISLISSQGLLTGLKIAVDRGYIEEAKQMLNALNKYCSNDCKTCGKYPNVINNNYYDYNFK